MFAAYCELQSVLNVFIHRPGDFQEKGCAILFNRMWVGWGKTPPLRVWWTSWSHTLLEHSIFLCHDSALLVEHICQFQLLWVYTFLYNSSLNEVFRKGQLAPWVGQDAPLPRASRPLGGNLPHGRERFATSVIYNSLHFSLLSNLQSMCLYNSFFYCAI